MSWKVEFLGYGGDNLLDKYEAGLLSSYEDFNNACLAALAYAYKSLGSRLRHNVSFTYGATKLRWWKPAVVSKEDIDRLICDPSAHVSWQPIESLGAPRNPVPRMVKRKETYFGE